MPIKVLSQTLINQIAAGEVIVRMASVVKELVENSIDAGATRIEISIRNDIRDVEVRDDGCGMNRDDVELCLQRHATSKISSVEDLFNLETRGFRGEAIPSIASVSRLEIQSRQPQSLSGTRVIVEGGKIQRIEPVGCPPGTRIVIRDLFFNTPARLKFLKSKVSEMNAVMSTITRQAIAQPSVGFRVERDGREVMELPSGQSLDERFASILGSQIKRDLVPVNFQRGEVQVSGYLAHPLDSRGDRRGQYFFVNDRPFSSKALVGSLEQACRGYVMIGRFPVLCLFITIPSEEVDFNVHPTKEEVRFQNERFIAGTIYHAAQEALGGSPALVGEMKLGEDDVKTTEEGTQETPPASQEAAAISPPPAFFRSPEQLIQRAFDRKQEQQTSQSDWLVEADRQRFSPSPQQAPFVPPGTPTRSGAVYRDSRGEVISAGPGENPDTGFWARGIEPEPLGQIANTYILVRYGEDLLVVDQHASHERLVYIDLKNRVRKPDTQPLLIPITLELEPAQSETLREMLALFEDLGIEISEFGPRTWAVNSLPADLPEFDPVPMIIELIDDMEQSKKINALEEMRDKILIRTACHSAIRAGMQLSMEKMRELLKQIKAERLSLTCPHGRPTIVRLSKNELDKQFKRIV